MHRAAIAFSHDPASGEKSLADCLAQRARNVIPSFCPVQAPPCEDSATGSKLFYVDLPVFKELFSGRADFKIILLSPCEPFSLFEGPGQLYCQKTGKVVVAGSRIPNGIMVSRRCLMGRQCNTTQRFHRISYLWRSNAVIAVAPLPVDRHQIALEQLS